MNKSELLKCGCWAEINRLRLKLVEQQAEVERLQAIATAAYNVSTQREAGACAEARQIGWEELEVTLSAGPSFYVSEIERLRSLVAKLPEDSG